MPFDPGSLSNGIYAAAGMLVGGFIVYHRVEGLVQDLRSGLKKLEDNQKSDFNKIWDEFEKVQLVTTCLERQKGCLLQWQNFKDSHEEIKLLFKDLRQDMKEELRLLRECITEVTKGKC